MNRRQSTQSVPHATSPRTLPGAFLACLVVCLGSGILLLFQYRPFGDVFQSVEEITSLAPFGFFFRRLHFYSGQACAVLALLHLLDHYRRRSYERLRMSAWSKLGASLAVCFGLLFTGFILKGDLEAQQAQVILASLAGSVPLAGTMLAKLVSAPEPWQFMPAYVLHCFILPLLLALLLKGHVKRLLPGKNLTVWTLLCIGGLALLAPLPLPVPPLSVAAEVHGPWFFHVLQTALRHGPPLLVGVALPLGLAGLYCILPRVSGTFGRAVRLLLAGSFWLYAGGTALLNVLGGLQ
jgi:ubiquinol-cytochrome c reductase cytochrome b subunit